MTFHERSEAVSFGEELLLRGCASALSARSPGDFVVSQTGVHERRGSADPETGAWFNSFDAHADFVTDVANRFDPGATDDDIGEAVSAFKTGAASLRDQLPSDHVVRLAIEGANADGLGRAGSAYAVADSIFGTGHAQRQALARQERIIEEAADALAMASTRIAQSVEGQMGDILNEIGSTALLRRVMGVTAAIALKELIGVVDCEVEEVPELLSKVMQGQSDD